MAIWYICWLIGIYSRFGKYYREKFGNPVRKDDWKQNVGGEGEEKNRRWSLASCLVVSSPIATVEAGATGREIEPHQGPMI
jgi:hypothetical protein